MKTTKFQKNMKKFRKVLKKKLKQLMVGKNEYGKDYMKIGDGGRAGYITTEQDFLHFSFW